MAAEGFLPWANVTQPMHLLAFQDDICRSFVLHKLTPGGSGPTKGMIWWLSKSPRVEVQSRTLISATKAMTASMFGRMCQQPKIIYEGEIFYGEAIRNLKSDLSHDVKAFTLETLGATMALSMYEVCFYIFTRSSGRNFTNSIAADKPHGRDSSRIDQPCWRGRQTHRVSGSNPTPELPRERAIP